MLVTVFLVVLVVALAMGNSFLFITKPRRLDEMRGLIARPVAGAEGSSGGSSSFYGQQRPGENTSHDEIYSLHSSNRALREKINIINARMDKIERLLPGNSDAQFAGSSIAVPDISRRIEKLCDFRNESKIEIAALKERVAALEAGRKMVPRNYKKAEEDLSQYEERIHNLVYRAGKD